MHFKRNRKKGRKRKAKRKREWRRQEPGQLGRKEREKEASKLRRSSRALYLNVVYDTGSLPMETQFVAREIN